MEYGFPGSDNSKMRIPFKRTSTMWKSNMGYVRHDPILAVQYGARTLCWLSNMGQDPILAHTVFQNSVPPQIGTSNMGWYPILDIPAHIGNSTPYWNFQYGVIKTPQYGVHSKLDVPYRVHPILLPQIGPNLGYFLPI